MTNRAMTELTQADRKRGVRRTTLWLALLALSFYVAFILMGVMNSK